MTFKTSILLTSAFVASAFLSLAPGAQAKVDAQAQNSAAPVAEAHAPLQDAFLYAYPVFEFAKVRYLASFAAPAGYSALNQFQHQRTLAGPSARAVTTPNNDTLYSSAFIDLSAGPVELATPDFGTRYWSVSLMDAYTNNFKILGRRTAGGNARHYLIVGPGWTGTAPEGDTVIHAPGNWIWALARIVVNGPDDLEAVHRLQAALVLKPTSSNIISPSLAPREGDGANFLAVVDQALAENPPPATDHDALARISAAGIGPGPAPTDSALVAAWSQALPKLEASLAGEAKSHKADVVGGWTLPPKQLGDFGQNYTLRATVALVGLAALPPAEAIYISPVTDQTGDALQSDRRYRLHIPKEGFPIDAFWSLSAYHEDPDGRLFFAENPIHRYAIGDRTQGLVKNADGSLDIYIQQSAPTDPKAAANWLPLPDGAVRLTLRLYQPHADAIAGAYRPAPLERLP